RGPPGQLSSPRAVGAPGGKLREKRVRARRESPGRALAVRRRGRYRLRFTRSCSISSEAVMTREFAWKPRSAMIMFVNSWARSTLDISSAPADSDPLDPTPGTPTRGTPEAIDEELEESPTRTRPAGLAKVAVAISPSTMFWPLE